MGAKNTGTVTVIGAGVAGLAASCALVDAGYNVSLLERRPYVGGRASSYEHPALHEVVDCQHVLLGCCTNLIHLLEQSGAADKVRWYDELNFLEPGGRRSAFTPNSLPAPLHFSDSFLRAPMLGIRDKLAIARGMSEFLSSALGDDEVSMEAWLKRTRQTPQAIRHFWEPVVLCTLNDGFANCSLRVTRKVFRELFLRSPEGARLGIPVVPLSDLYAGAVRLIEEKGGKVCLRESVDSIVHEEDGRWRVAASSGKFVSDAVVLAVPFEQVEKLLPNRSGTQLGRHLEHFIHAPYTTVHLWFDREITDLDHAALLDTGIQWMFHKSRIRGYASERGSYVELVIAASRAQLKVPREQILSQSISELHMFFPEVKTARLVKSGILKEPRATFSVLPGLDKFRPHPVSEWPGIYLAGDWTSTGWPATMESAARSGYLAAEALTMKAREPRRFLLPDLPPTGMMRLFD